VIIYLAVEDLSPDLRQKWAASRVWAAHEAPYLASALLALEPVVVDESAADGARADLRAFPADPQWFVYIDPDVLAEVEVGELGFWLLHQVSHLLRKHAARFPAADASPREPAGPLGGRTAEERRWNVATDAEIDDDLHTGRLQRPERAVHPSDLAFPSNLTGEQYWDLLDDHWVQTKIGHLSENDCGSGCDGRERPWDCDKPGMSQARAGLVARDTARQIREHTRKRGDTPAGWARWADDVLEPTVDWRRELAAQVRRGAGEVAGRVDFTYRRPSRRASAVPDVVMPSLRLPLPRVALVFDTSGSISDPMLGEALGEVAGVLRSVGAGRDLRLICCDAQAYQAQSVRNIGRVELAGGGGTDMGVGIRAASELRPRPDVVVVLTDGHTPWPPAAPPGIRVIVGLTDQAGRTPGWADTVLVGEAARGRR
jgi:predicted metal-dependent peptidase